MGQLMRYQRNIRIVFHALIGIAFVWFFIRDLNPSGKVSVSYNLCKPSPYISALSPMGRVLDIEHREGYCVQKMVIDPVYVDVRLPQRYDTATMVIIYQKPDVLPFQAGPWVSATEWRWALQSLETVGEREDGWQTAVAHFDIRERPMDRRRLRFMLSSPGLAESGEDIIIKEIRFEFEKPFMSLGMAKRWMASFL